MGPVRRTHRHFSRLPALLIRHFLTQPSHTRSIQHAKVHRDLACHGFIERRWRACLFAGATRLGDCTLILADGVFCDPKGSFEVVSELEDDV